MALLLASSLAAPLQKVIQPDAVPPGAGRQSGPAVPTTMDGATCPAGCVQLHADKPAPLLSMHGDPIFRINGTVNTHFWIKTGVMTPLLAFPTPPGLPKSMDGKWQISGETFSDDDGANQWFDDIELSFNEFPLLSVNGKSDDGHTEVSFEKSDISDKMKAGFQKFANGVKIEVKDIGEKEKGRKRLDYGYNNGTKLAVSIGPLKMLIYSHTAAKYSEDDEQKGRFTHLNINFWSDLPDEADGLFAELAGIKPLSPATRAVLKKPDVFEKQRSQGSSKGPTSSCMCPPTEADMAME